MVAMVFMILYLIAVIAVTLAFMLAWHDDPSDFTAFAAILIAIICGIGWPIVLIGVVVYAVKYGMLEEEEES